MSSQRSKPRQNIEDEDLEIDMLGWDTPKGKNLLTSRKAKADARRKAQSPRRQTPHRFEIAPGLEAPPHTLQKHQHYDISTRQQSGTTQDARHFPLFQPPRQTNAPPRINEQSQIKVRRSQAHNDIELKPLSQRYEKWRDLTYDPIRDPTHPVHADSDVPLRGVEDAQARDERTRLRARKTGTKRSKKII